MAATVLFHRLALKEYRAAERWYVHRSARAGQRFQDEVEKAVERIAASPDRWSTFGLHHRWVRVARFPYVIYYQILDPSEVLIVAVAHGRRRLGYWSRRTWP
jgi:plasmid stabilization system protein ParE